MSTRFDCQGRDLVEPAGNCSGQSTADSLRSEAYQSNGAEPVRAVDLYNRLNVNPSRDNDDYKYLTKDELALALHQDRQAGAGLLNEQERQTVKLLLDEFNMVKKLSKAKGEDNDGISIIDLQIFLDKNADRLKGVSTPKTAAISESEIAQMYSLANVNLSNDKDDPKYLTKRELAHVLHRDSVNGGTLLNDKQRELAAMLLGQFDKAKKLSKMKGEDNDGISFYDLKIFAEANRTHLETVGRAQQERELLRKPASPVVDAPKLPKTEIVEPSRKPSPPVIEDVDPSETHFVELPRKPLPTITNELPPAEIVDLSAPVNDKPEISVQPSPVEPRDNYSYHPGSPSDNIPLFEDISNIFDAKKNTEDATTPEYAVAREREIKEEQKRLEFKKRMAELEAEEQDQVTPPSLSLVDTMLLQMLEDADRKSEQAKTEAEYAAAEIAAAEKTAAESATAQKAAAERAVAEKVAAEKATAEKAAAETLAAEKAAEKAAEEKLAAEKAAADKKASKLVKVFDNQGYREKFQEITTAEETITDYNNLWRITTRDGKVYVQRPRIDDSYLRDDEFTPTWQNQGEGWELGDPEEASGFDPETISRSNDLHEAGFRFWLDNPKSFWGF